MRNQVPLSQVLDCKSGSPISRDSEENKGLRQFCKLYPPPTKLKNCPYKHKFSIRNKLDLLSDQVKEKVDISIISEIKIDESFPICHFEIDGFNTPFGVDKDQKFGGITLYVREHVPAKLLSIDRTNECCFVELNLKRTK